VWSLFGPPLPLGTIGAPAPINFDVSLRGKPHFLPFVTIPAPPLFPWSPSGPLTCLQISPVFPFVFLSFPFLIVFCSWNFTSSFFVSASCFARSCRPSSCTSLQHSFFFPSGLPPPPSFLSDLRDSGFPGTACSTVVLGPLANLANFSWITIPLPPPPFRSCPPPNGHSPLPLLFNPSMLNLPRMVFLLASPPPPDQTDFFSRIFFHSLFFFMLAPSQELTPVDFLSRRASFRCSRGLAFFPDHRPPSFFVVVFHAPPPRSRSCLRGPKEDSPPVSSFSLETQVSFPLVRRELSFAPNRDIYLPSLKVPPRLLFVHPGFSVGFPPPASNPPGNVSLVF